MDALGVEGHDDFVFALGAVDGAQYVVGADYRGGGAVDGTGPAGVVYLAEDDGSVVGVVRLVLELGGAVVGEAYAGGAVGRLWMEWGGSGVWLVDGVVSEVGGAEGCELVVGVVCADDVVYVPCVAEGVGVEDGTFASFVEGGYDVAHVEHVEHGVEAVAADGAEVALGLVDGSLQGLHLGAEVGFDDFLVAAELGCVVAADAFVPV